MKMLMLNSIDLIQTVTELSTGRNGSVGTNVRALKMPPNTL